jgi:hypothetical protein
VAQVERLAAEAEAEEHLKMVLTLAEAVRVVRALSL